MKTKQPRPHIENLSKIKKLIARRKKIGLDKIKFKEDQEYLTQLRIISWAQIDKSSFLIKPVREIPGKKPNVKVVVTSSVKKKNWVKKIRNQRIILKSNRKQAGLSYRKLYKEIKGNVFKNRRELLARINEEKTN